MGFLTGKKALITGIASDRSLAYAIAQAFYEQGAELALTYQNEKLESRVRKAASLWGDALVYPCDVEQEHATDTLCQALSCQWTEGWDIMVHAIAFAPADQLTGDYLDCLTPSGFRIAHDISAYSFAALGKSAKPFLRDRGALLTLSYLGAERAVPHYNVMGLAKASLEANVRYMAVSLGNQNVRVNAVSAGPVRTLAASGIKDLKKMLDTHAQISPLKRNISAAEVGNTAAFLCSDLASGITGEIVHVDSGVHIMGPHVVHTA